MKEVEVKSKRYIVFADRDGRKAALVEFEWPEEDMAIDGLYPIGIVYDHPSDVYGDREHANVVGKPISGNPEISDLVGKVLTLADAMFGDKEQREALKSLLKQTLYGYSNDGEERVRQTYQVAKRQLK